MLTQTLSDIATLLNCPSPSDPGRPVTGIATLVEAGPADLSFLGSEKYLPDFVKTRAAAVIVQKRVKLPADHGRSVLIVDDADLAVAQLLERFAPPVPRPPAGRHPTAIVGAGSTIGEGARVGPHVVLGEDCRVGRNAVLHAGVVIGANVTIGDDCELFANVVVRERVTIGNRVVIHAGAVLGTDGFGYRWDGRQHVKVPQIGTIVIEDDVEIGSCACIDRAKFSTTRVGRGSKIDNLVQIAHNVVVGPMCIITGQVGIAGSARLGAGVVLGGQCAVRDHVSLGDGSAVAACSAVAEDVDAKTIVSGLPALPHRQSLREQAALRRLPDLVVQVRKLQEQLDELRKGK
ncbi:MAG TPA: UDP-3-O-(3-hydroxymyristoyl)glucosamine N-acyltransferase [Tepidisphaeraceae bacterium]|nr:UDP-3-O-(3-hydroxymyristoyl)glucosamine N-acyltransferase [Tepidisphaeraceae bacterium]